MEDKYMHIDEAFSSKLTNQEEAFDPKAWDQMTQLMDKPKRERGLIIPFFKKSKTKIIITMTTALLLTTLLYINVNTSSPNQAATPLQVQPVVEAQVPPQVEQSTTPNTIGSASPSSVNTSSDKSVSKNSVPAASNNNKRISARSAMPVRIPSLPVAAEVSNEKESIKQLANDALQAGELYIPTLKNYIFSSNADVTIYNSPEELTNSLFRRKKKYRFNLPWIGIHLAGNIPMNELRTNGYRKGLGFDIELMTGDLLKHKRWGVSLGGDFGFTGDGRSSKHNVLLQTPKLDSGQTFLHNISFMGNFIARFEYGSRRLKPYFDVNIGLKNMTTLQNIQSNKTLDSFEDASNSVNTAWALTYGASLGLRYHLVPGVSLDLRGTWYSGTDLTWANVRQSDYVNSGTFNLKKYTTSADNFHLRIGFLFDIDCDKDVYYQRDQHDSRNQTGPAPGNYPAPNNGGNNRGGRIFSNPSSTPSTPKAPVKIAPPVIRH
jgi:hypothetical protein